MLAILVGVILAACATQAGHQKTALSDIRPPTPDSERRSIKEPDPATKTNLQVTYAKLPLSFEPNRGQTDEQVHFLSRRRGYTLFLTSTEAVLALRRHTAPKMGCDPHPCKMLPHQGITVVGSLDNGRRFAG